MEPFRQHEGVAAPLLLDNVDTDQIIPSREMKRVSKSGLGQGLFAGWRYRYDGAERVGDDPSFILNEPAYEGASILLAGDNFGCGSSREHAVWALLDYGIRAVIAESFGRIFRNNCARNGLLAIELPADRIATLVDEIETDPPRQRIAIDLERNVVVAPGGEQHEFEIPPADREMLLEGLDYIDYTLRYESDIDAFVAADRNSRPWAYL